MVEAQLSKTTNTKTSKTLNNLIENWLISKKELKESSYSRYYNLINEHIKDDICKIKINKLNDKIVNNYINKKLKSGRLDNQGGLSNNTVYDICSLLRQIFKEYNIDIKVNKVQKKIGVGKTYYKKDKEILEKELKNNISNISIGIELSLLLGLRESEVCGLTFKNIDLDSNIIYINQIVSRVKSFDTHKKTKVILSTPKTINSKRELPIPSKLINELKKIKENKDDDCFLLTGTSKYMDPRTFYNHYKRFLKSLNINTPYTYHDLRHTFATNCIELGSDYKSLMELLGHSNISTTMNIYVHPTLDNKRKFIDRL